DTIIITDLTGGSVNNYLWDFGDNAIPASATSAGPHQVVYTQPGTKTVQLQVDNDGGITAKVLPLIVGAEPQADFSSNTNLNVVKFTDLSTNGPTQWTWDFGDGSSSNLSNPTHGYTNAGV